MSEPLLVRGVDGTTGRYFVRPVAAEDLIGVVRGEQRPETLEDLQHLEQAVAERKRRRTLQFGVDSTDLAQTGWGVVFPARPKVPVARLKQALTPLLEHRRRVAAAVKSDLYREYSGRQGYEGETSARFLADHGAGIELVDPAKMPYYLLLVGDPEEIPFDFQYDLGTRYAVGRIHFDHLDDYRCYAESVVRAESRPVPLPRRITFFGVENGDDEATRCSTRELVKPLATALQNLDGWEVADLVRKQATRERLLRLLGGEETPALLFTGSHGMSYRRWDERQERLQGALLCGDWPGPHVGVERAHYLAAEDVGEVSLLGLIAFHFACFSAGTPQRDNFAYPESPKDLERFVKALPSMRPMGEKKADRAFVAGLPKRLLSLPKGGALAVVGHVDRAWSFSFSLADAGSETPLFVDVIRRLLAGRPLGHATAGLRQRYATLATQVAAYLDRSAPAAESFDLLTLARMWVACTDARNFVILGDPAVRVLGDGGRRRGRR